ncbi:thioredoxin-like protein [Daedaleopsis nitida]|nr:thioredoxin-like protein [Daedaleopsis nitida]
MVQPGQITLYDHPTSPFTHRVTIALKEAKAEYTSIPIDLHDKPEWFATKVNPAGKIPALSYGGPKTAPEDPSSEAAILTESLVIVEFIAELFPESQLQPTDLVQRAKARLFITVIEGKIIDSYRAFFIRGESNETLLAGFEALQARLPATGFAVGDWSIADVAAAPILVRIMTHLENDIGKYPAGEGTKTLQELRKPKYARLMKYIEDSSNRPIIKSTFSKSANIEYWKKLPFFQRN